MTFSRFAHYLQDLERTSARNEMTTILASLFSQAPADEIAQMCYLLLGRVAPLFDPVEFGLAEKFMIRAISASCGISVEKVAASVKRKGDVGIAAQELYKGTDRKLSVTDVFDRLLAVARLSGSGSQERKIEQIAGLLSHTDPLSARYIARIPLDKLRLGFSDMTILDSLSWFLARNKSLRVRLEDAYNVRPDIGYIAHVVKVDGLAGLTHIRAKLGVPILSALCQRLPSADEMVSKMGTVAVEPKYDGVRVQIHYKKSSGTVTTFSRNLENTTAMFPELSGIAGQLSLAEAILDAEAVGVDPKTGKLISFQETMTRKRKHNIQDARMNVPLVFFVFDILYYNGKQLLSTALSQRRLLLEKTVKEGTILRLSPVIVTDSPEKIRQIHDSQIRSGLEGVVVKKWDGTYEPGRRGFSWVKFKEEEGKTGKLTDTIDAVVMGYSTGQGKRTAFGIGQVLLGVQDREQFVTVTKLGSGATEDELKKLRDMLVPLRTKDKPREYKDVHKAYIPDFWVVPKLVLEVAGDDLTQSPTHGAGVAIRFPRLVRIRPDKSPATVTTVKELGDMFRSQANQR